MKKLYSPRGLSMADAITQPYSLSVKTDGRINLKAALKDAAEREKFSPIRKFK